MTTTRSSSAKMIASQSWDAGDPSNRNAWPETIIADLMHHSNKKDSSASTSERNLERTRLFSYIRVLFINIACPHWKLTS